MSNDVIAGVPSKQMLTTILPNRHGVSSSTPNLPDGSMGTTYFVAYPYFPNCDTDKDGKVIMAYDVCTTLDGALRTYKYWTTRSKTFSPKFTGYVKIYMQMAIISNVELMND